MLECSSMEYIYIYIKEATVLLLFAGFCNVYGELDPRQNGLCRVGLRVDRPARIFGSPVLTVTGVNGAVGIGTREVKFLDRAKTNLSEGIPQVHLH
jgi:hypothetical protein